MFTFTLTAESVEELQGLILAAAIEIPGQQPTAEKTLEDFSLQEIAEYLKTKGFELK